MALAVFSIISPASFGFFISAEPSPLFTIFGTGHPMLMSKMSNGLSSIWWAILEIISGSQPKSCKDTGSSLSSIAISSSVFLFLYIIAFALTISIHNSPAPCSLHNKRNGRSVTPAIGANIKLFGKVTLPIVSGFIIMLSTSILCGGFAFYKSKECLLM